MEQTTNKTTPSGVTALEKIKNEIIDALGETPKNIADPIDTLSTYVTQLEKENADMRLSLEIQSSTIKKMEDDMAGLKEEIFDLHDEVITAENERDEVESVSQIEVSEIKEEMEKLEEMTLPVESVADEAKLKTIKRIYRQLTEREIDELEKLITKKGYSSVDIEV